MRLLLSPAAQVLLDRPARCDPLRCCHEAHSMLVVRGAARTPPVRVEVVARARPAAGGATLGGVLGMAVLARAADVCAATARHVREAAAAAAVDAAPHPLGVGLVPRVARVRVAAEAARRRPDCVALTLCRAEEDKEPLLLLVDGEGAPRQLLERRARRLSRQELTFSVGVDARGGVRRHPAALVRLERHVRRWRARGSNDGTFRVG
eukprot:scaffold102330_cov63-Phaeocystis_antarctica.AAC.4